MVADFPGTPENQGSKVSNALYWLANYAVTEGSNDPANEGSPPPDMMGVQVSGTAIVGGGGGVDLMFGYVKGDGFFGNASLRMGDGFDVSLSFTGVAAKYRGKGNPTSKSLQGLSFYQSASYLIFTGGSFQDMYRDDADKVRIGNTWIGGSFGISTPGVGGEAGVSITTPPLRFSNGNE